MHNDWHRGEFRDCIEEITSGKSVNSVDEPATNGHYGVLKTSCVYNGRFDPTENKRVIDTEKDLVKCPARKGNIVVSRMNTASLVGASGLIEDNYSNLFLPDRLWLVTPSSQIDARWFALVVGSPEVRRQLGDAASGTSASMKNISQETFLAMPVAIPPLAEQRKIAEMLLAWDEAIEKLEALRSAKSRRLTGLRSGLLFGSMRLEKTRTNWEPHRLADVTLELTQRNSDLTLGRDSVMGVTNTRGIVPMREQTVAEDISRYKRLPPKAFAYNPMRINVGSIAMNDNASDVLVSPDYVVFACKSGGLAPDYLDHLRQTFWWSHHITSGGSGSVRQRTYYDDLAALHLPLPDIKEQQKIVHVLNTARDDLLATERMVEIFRPSKTRPAAKTSDRRVAG